MSVLRKENISDAVIRRLPRYYRQLTDLCARGVVRISSHSLGQEMNITASQIRQDFSCFGEFGQQGYGYNVEELRSEIGHILGGAVVIENIFCWPGVGGLFIDAVNARDLPMIEGCVLVIAFGYAVINLVVDIIYVWINPEVRYTGEES